MGRNRNLLLTYWFQRIQKKNISNKNIGEKFGFSKAGNNKHIGFFS